MVVAGVDERDAKRPQPAVLRVALLQVAQPAHQLLARNLVVVGEQVALRGLAGEVDEDVGVGGHAGDGADHVAARWVSGCWKGMEVSDMRWVSLQEDGWLCARWE